MSDDFKFAVRHFLRAKERRIDGTSLLPTYLAEPARAASASLPILFALDDEDPSLGIGVRIDDRSVAFATRVVVA